MADKAIPAVLTGIKQQNFFSAVPAVQVRQHPLVAFGNGEFPAAAGTADGSGNLKFTVFFLFNRDQIRLQMCCNIGITLI